MTIRTSFLFAWRMLFPKTDRISSARKSLSGALICIGVSLVPLIAVLTVSSGMIGGMTERIIGLSSSHLSAYVMRTAPEVSSADRAVDYASSFTAVSGITDSYPEIDATVLALSRTYRTGAQIRAVPPRVLTGDAAFKKLLTVESGSFSSFAEGSRTAVIGSRIASLLGVSAGSTFRIVAMSPGKDGAVSLKTAQFTVAAVVSSGYQELDALWVFIPVSAAYEFLPLNTSTITIHMETADAFSPELPRIQNNVQEFVGGIANVYRWDEVNRSEFENFSSTKVMLLFIMMLIVLVASVNISSALIMLVMERRREIAILKSIGATPQGITLSFLLTGLATGLGGVLIGVPAGILCALNINKIIVFFEKTVNIFAEFVYLLSGRDAAEYTRIHLMDPAYYLAEVPVTIPVRDLCVITGATLILSLVVSVIPAYRAGKEKPLETFRKV